MNNIILVILGFIIMSLHATCQAVKDIDGNVYQTVKIGSQVWLQENLKVAHYRNGEAIPVIEDGDAWQSLTTGACCIYNDSAANLNVYGRLYNAYAVSDSRQLCPAGWRVASDADWTALTDFLGDESTAGGKLKESGTDHWNAPNKGATNESGFLALPGGSRSSDGDFNLIGRYGRWWTSTESSPNNAWLRILSYDQSNISSYDNIKGYGFSVRCIMDSK